MARVPKNPVDLPDAAPEAIVPVVGTMQDFPFDEPLYEADDLFVWSRLDDDSSWTVRTDFSVVLGTGSPQTGYDSATVQFDAPLVAGTDADWVRIERQGSFRRLSHFPQSSPLDLRALNRDLARIVGLAQTLRSMYSRTLQLETEVPTDELAPGVFSLGFDRVGKLISFDTDGSALLVDGNVSAWMTFSSNGADNPPATPTGDGNEGDWSRSPGGDANWISFSEGATPGANGWSEPILFIGQQYQPNLYMDWSYEGPHVFEWDDGEPVSPTDPEIQGYVTPDELEQEFTHSGTDPDNYQTGAFTFVTTLGTAVSYAWSWARGGQGMTIDSPTAASTTITVNGDAEQTFSGRLAVLVTDAGGKTIRQLVEVLATIGASAGGLPALSISLSSTSLNYAGAEVTDVNYFDSVPVEATPSGGVGPFRYMWSKVQGDAGVKIRWNMDRESPVTIFRGKPTDDASGLVSATFECAVTDSKGQVAAANVTVSMDFIVTGTQEDPLAVSVNVPELTESAPSGAYESSAIEASASGGTGPYSYAWDWKTGGANLTINSPAAASTTIQADSNGGEFFGVARCTVTDSSTPTAQTKTATVVVNIAKGATAAALSGEVKPKSLSRTLPAVEGPIGDVRAFATGGVPPYTFEYRRLSIGAGGNGGILRATWAPFFKPKHPEHAYFFGSKLGEANFYQQTWRCTITDAEYQFVHVDFPVQVQFTSSSPGPGYPSTDPN